MPEKLEAAFISNAENTRGVFSVMQIIRKFVDPTMEPYFKGESDYEACAAQLESQLRLYLNE